MKKLLTFTTGILLAGATWSNAQTQKSYISLGPTVALGHSWIRSVPANGDRDFKLSPAIGIGMVISHREHWGYSTGLVVSHEGYKADYRMPNGDYEKVAVNPVYLRMPMNVTYFFGKYGDAVRPKIYAGPNIGVKVDEKRWYSMDDPRTVEGNMANSDHFTRWDVGLNAGIGANIRVSRYAWLNLDAGYYHGLVDVLKTDANGDYNANRNIRLNVGMMWGL